MKQERKQLYEGMYILSTTLSEEARAKALDRITTGMSEQGGEVHKIFDWGRKKLAYEIKGKREGYYYIIYFTSPSSSMTHLWSEYHLNEDLIRFMTTEAKSVPENIEFKSLVRE
ncbi:MAG: 30S ribosomal protein S6 [Chlamydiae bacterium GWC2_50_10]|nr:MAG: 30S ribosomal protein S6 [Chlamydiae bacterium GWA2_50_15]OGN54100.1 MAG: 30S ribosomal protein S6 [Chlamydiae bacterium GWC2_50_10]OGN54478.1 MAG: 30S ribosomal protein S6 [Chlamydiae bacterium GWF2_49_8]OGN57563.1 MAG: 30S ribosomal protein S6 [Chlamydiae bacterium RIFCSPHIGHO2_02_FULL_49_29]OGN63072.1 MAG: 30S ribosomal protein S6 [Chlamydiae bacterium RIFCSPHIGHO2_12_FULL_49_32]OGN70159.1 MAG: 30S ribosomal protein S6 [Chlamydiae bacterium RIFCSPLOWO2_02_FULL_49_12]OGN74776.1 MAG: